MVDQGSSGVSNPTDTGVDLQGDHGAKSAKDTVDPLNVGDILCNGKYTIAQRLTRTPVSILYRGLQQPDAEPVVLKAVAPRHCEEVGQREVTALKRVAAMAARPAAWCVQLLGSFSDVGRAAGDAGGGTALVLVLENLGHSAAQVLVWLRARRRMGLQADAVRNFARQSLDALDDLHANCGMVHGDIKPSNFVLAQPFLHSVENPGGKRRWRCLSAREMQEAQWKLVDFGSALQWAAPNAAADGVPPGASTDSLALPASLDFHSLPYAAPEVVLGLPESPASDMWALACSIYELATGRQLFNPQDGEDEEFDAEHHQLWLVTQLIGRVRPSLLAKAPRATVFFDRDARLFLQRQYDLRGFGLWERLRTETNYDDVEVAGLADMLTPLLEWDPQLRADAASTRKHIWLQHERPASDDVDSI